MASGQPLRAPRRTVEAVAADTAIRLALLAVCLYWLIILVAPFASLVLWAIIIAVSLYPLHQWLARGIGGRPTLAAALITIVGLAVVLGPAAALAISLAESLRGLVTELRNGTLSVPEPPQAIQNWPVIGDSIHDFWTSASANLREVISTHRELLLSTAMAALGKLANVATDTLVLAVAIIIAGFMFRRYSAMSDNTHRVARRVLAQRGRVFVEIAGDTIRNVSRGVVGIAVLQALLAGGAILIIGVPAAGMITVGILILCVVQLGPALILVPVVIWAWNTMSAAGALAFTVYIIPVALIDNVLKPIVMARGLRTPMLVIFIGLIGGVLAHGLIGVFLGPILVAVVYELATAWVAEGPARQPVSGSTFVRGKHRIAAQDHDARPSAGELH